jgi:predicted negative regulator of RcsB-dependent stress response
MYYDAMRQAVRSGLIDQAIEDGKRLIGDYGSTAYASFAGLELARLAYNRDEPAVARGHLQWVADSAPDPALRELARLRLGRLLLDSGELDALQQLLTASPLPAFAGEFAELRGDLARVRGNAEDARVAYQEALVKGVDDESLLRMKLVDVGGPAPTS